MANVFTRRLFTKNVFRMKGLSNLTKQNRCAGAFFVTLKCNNGILFHKDIQQKSPYFIGNSKIHYSDEKKKCEKPPLPLFQRFKEMYKDYWYVLVPVHLVTSIAWFGGFYYMAESGVNVVGILESMNVSDRIVNPLRDSSMGYIALAYAMYKIATPVRYTVTLGGTTVAINYLKEWGYIKPVPCTERLKEMYFEQKDNLIETMRETKEGLKIQSDKLKDKKENIIEDFDKGLKQIKELGDKIKCKETFIEELKKKQKKQKEEAQKEEAQKEEA